MQVCTHSGRFHSDDILAFSILKLWNPNVILKRSRDPKVWADSDIVFDVGMGRFDHHMNDAQGKPYRLTGQPYSSAGLIWKDYGRSCIRSVLGQDKETVNAGQIDYMFKNIDENFILPFDLHDNGISVGTEFPISIMDILSSFNPLWDEDNNPEYEYARFIEASTITTAYLKNKILKLHSGLFIDSSIKKNTLPSPHEKLFIINSHVPCNSYLNKNPNFLFHIFPSSDMWRVRAINIGDNTFAVRKPFPKAWAGLESSELAKLTGAPTARFCHTGLFIAGATEFNDAVTMALAAINSPFE